MGFCCKMAFRNINVLAVEVDTLTMTAKITKIRVDSLKPS